MDDLQGNFPYLDDIALQYLRELPTARSLERSIKTMNDLFPHLTHEQAVIQTHICFVCAKRSKTRENDSVKR